MNGRYMPASTIIERRRRERNNNIMQFPDDLGAHAMLLLFKKYEYKKPGTRTLNRVSNETLSTTNLVGADNILLPLPSNITDSFNIRISRFDQELRGELVSAGAAAIGSENIGIGNLAGVLSSVIPTPDFNAIMSMDIDKLSRDAAFLARRTLDSRLFAGASRNLDAGFGNILNPKAALHFEGIEMKTHTFNWVFAPRSESESLALKNISDTIKRNILPSYGNIAGFNKVILNYPSTVDIFFFGVDQSYFMFFKTCMVTTFTIDFSPQGLAFLKGGKPAMINMQMNLMESDIHTSEDYGGSGTDIASPPSDTN
jgi:hypothetical protein